GSGPLLEETRRFRGRKRPERDPLDGRGPRGKSLRPARQQDEDALCARGLRREHFADERRESGVARGVEPREVVDPDEDELVLRTLAHERDEGPEEPRAALVRLDLGDRRCGVRGPEDLEPEGPRDRIDESRARKAPVQRGPHTLRRFLLRDAEEVPAELGERMERKGAPVRESARSEPRSRRSLRDLVAEAALPGTRLAGQQQDTRPSVHRVGERSLETSELGVAADEGREPAGTRAVETRAERAAADEVEDAERSARALDAMLAAVREREEARDELRG